MNCPKCGSSNTSTYRHMNAKVWCSDCGYVLREDGKSEYNPDVIDLHPYKMNNELADIRDIPPDRRTAIQEVGDDLMRFLLNHDKFIDNSEVSGIIQGYEFVLQRLWGFEYDGSKHRYQLNAKGCTCKDLMDNENYMGGPIWVSGECPIHNFNIKSEIEK